MCLMLSRIPFKSKLKLVITNTIAARARTKQKKVRIEIILPIGAVPLSSPSDSMSRLFCNFIYATERVTRVSQVDQILLLLRTFLLSFLEGEHKHFSVQSQWEHEVFD